VNGNLRVVLSIGVVLILSTIALIALPLLLSSDACQLTVEGSEVSTKGEGIVRYVVRLPAGSTLISGRRVTSRVVDEGNELEARSIPGWPLQARRSMGLGNVEDLFVRMKGDPEFWRRSLDRALLLDKGTPYVVHKGERLDFFQVGSSTFYFELR
jgi:hypothetical protein